MTAFAPAAAERVLELAAGSSAFARRLLELSFRVEACDLYPDQFLFGRRLMLVARKPA